MVWGVCACMCAWTSVHVRAYSSDVGIVEAWLAVSENRCGVMPERLRS